MHVIDEVTAVMKPHKGFNGTGDAYMDQLKEWEVAKQILDRAKELELDLRLRCFTGAFPNPKEGTNTHKLPDGRELKGQHKVNRNIDEAALPAVLEELRKLGCANTDVLVRYKPELAKREWNDLSDEHKLVFSAAVIATPGTPQFDVVTPKRRGRASA